MSVLYRVVYQVIEHYMGGDAFIRFMASHFLAPYALLFLMLF